MRIGVQTLARAKPSMAAIGTVNELAFTVGASGEQGPEADRMQIVINLFEAICNHWHAQKKLQYVVIPNRSLSKIDSVGLHGTRFKVGIPPLLADLTFSELIALFHLIDEQAKQVADSRGNCDPMKPQSFQAEISLSPSLETIKRILPRIAIRDPELGLIKLTAA